LLLILPVPQNTIEKDRFKEIKLRSIYKEQENRLLDCISSFNGFSLYRTQQFLNTYYDGRIRLDLIPKSNLEAHKNITKSKLVFKKYVTVDGHYEDCEHRAFHIQAKQNSGTRIMISPEILFK
jgi:hypothetical protein